MGEKFTPGPWAYRPHEHDDWGIVRAPVTEQGQFMGGIICQARDPEALGETTLALHRAHGTDPWEANARLIAAAPGLVEALRKLLAMEITAFYAEQWDDINRARALLARIDGGAA